MPNIVIVGFNRSKEIQLSIEMVVTAMDLREETITTILSGSSARFCQDEQSAPYLVVRDTKLGRARLIARTLNKDLDVDVEIEQISGFLPRSKPRTARDFVRAGHR